MRYVLLSTPGGHEWEHPLDLIVDTQEKMYFELWAYTSNKPVVINLNNRSDRPEKYHWYPWSQYEPSEHWAEHHGETFEETTARLFNDLPVQGEKPTSQKEPINQ